MTQVVGGVYVTRRVSLRTIAHISDVHFDLVEPRVVDALAREIAEDPPSLVVNSGDFTQRARRGQFANAMAFMRRLPGPQLLIPGNHDIPLFDVVRRFLSPL